MEAGATSGDVKYDATLSKCVILFLSSHLYAHCLSADSQLLWSSA